MKKKSLVAMLVVVCSIILMHGISVQASNHTLEIGQTMNVRVNQPNTSYPAVGGANYTYVWSITHYKAEGVDSLGLPRYVETRSNTVVKISSYSSTAMSNTITALAPGKARVSCKCIVTYNSMNPLYPMNSNIQTVPRNEQISVGTWDIIVNLDPTGVSLPESVSVDVGNSKTIEATFTPSGASSSLSWSSSNKSVATVSGGKVTAVAPGTATITVRTANGYSDTCNVTVTKPELKLVSKTYLGDKYFCANFVYNSDIVKGDKFSDITIYDNTTGSYVYAYCSISGKTLEIGFNKYAGHSYTVTVPAGAVENEYGGKCSENATLKIEKEKLKFVGCDYDGRDDFNPGRDISIEFSDEVEKGSQWWRINFYNEYGVFVDYTVEDCPGRSDMLNIAPKTKLDYDTEYTIEICPGSVSCGGVDWDGSATIKFKTEKDPAKAIPPVITRDGEWVKITCENSSAKIYYTLDGSMPTTSSMLYDDTIRLKSAYTQIKAISAAGNDVSEVVSASYSLDVDTLYDEIYRNNDLDIGMIADVEATNSGGYVAVGWEVEKDFGKGNYAGISGKGSSDAVIVKFDANNNIEWIKNFGGSDEEKFESVAVTESGYVAVGWSYEDSFKTGDWRSVSGKGGTDAIIVKYNSSGSIVWKKAFGCSSYDSFNSVIATADGGFVAVGSSCKLGNGDWKGSSGYKLNVLGYEDEATIVKFDADGNVVWKNFVGGRSSDCFNSVTQTADGGFVAVGYVFAKDGDLHDGDWSGMTGYGEYDAIAVKFDEFGNLKWKKVFGGKGDDEFDAVASSPDGGVVTVTYSDEDSFGTGSLRDLSNSGENESVAVKYNKSGEIEWKKKFDSRVDLIEATGDGRFILADSGGLIKIDSTGDIRWESGYYCYGDALTVLPNGEYVYLSGHIVTRHGLPD